MYATKQLKSAQTVDAVNKAIQAWEKITSNPDSKNNPEFYAKALTQNAILLLTRYRVFENKDDIDNAIALLKQSINLVSSNSQLIPNRLSNLGTCLISRYSRTGGIEDLEEAIESFKQAISLTDPKAPELPAYLTNLGNCLISRYSQTGDLNDREEAIKNFRQAVSLKDSKAPKLPHIRQSRHRSNFSLFTDTVVPNTLEILI